MILSRGTQIAYLPSHANGDLKHKDVQWGFVTSGPKGADTDQYYFCRYWRSKDSNELRTKANSEATPLGFIRLIDSHTPEQVQAALDQFC